MYCYVFGALEIESFDYKINDTDLVIAADNGIKNTNKFNIKPHFVIGDFDSLGFVPEGNNIIVHPVEKDDTDTMLAVKKGFEKGYNNFKIFGCIGGRLDHTIANIQTASYIAQNGGTCTFVGDKECFTVIKNSSISFNESHKGDISVFALENSTGVNIKGLHYEIENGQLTPDFPLGASNKFTNNPSEITVKSGTLLIIWQKQNLI